MNFKSIEEYIDIVSKRLKPSRMKHTLGVMKKAKELSEIYGISSEKAMIAAVLHDYLSDDELKKYIEDKSIEVDKESNMNISLMHGLVGSYMVREELGIEDEEILDAISYHTFGRENMSLIEKIVFLADAIEDGRDYDGVEAIREESRRDIDKAIILSIENTLMYVLKNGHIVHLNSVRLRNELINKNS